MCDFGWIRYFGRPRMALPELMFGLMGTLPALEVGRFELGRLGATRSCFGPAFEIRLTPGTLDEIKLRCCIYPFPCPSNKKQHEWMDCMLGVVDGEVAMIVHVEPCR